MRTNCKTVSLALALLAAGTPVLAQTARIVGTVRDQSRAVIPGVAVEALNLATNATRTVTTNALGDYVISALPLGSYQVSVEVTGFKHFVLAPIVLAVDQAARVDIELEPGQVTETVTVASFAPVVNSETSSVGQVIEETQVKHLPLNGRHFMQLGLLVPGTTPGRDGTVSSRQGGYSISVNGQPPNQNNWMLDGVDNNAIMFGLAVVIPSTEAIREFRLEVSNYSAEYGRSAGGVVNVQIKSGTNMFHGSLFEFHRNDDLDEVRYFDVGVPPQVYNQFGGTLGGPVFRNRTFFFSSYEGQRIRRGRTVGGMVPTPEMKQGDYAGLPAIFDPLSLDRATNLRQPFQGNRIPATRFHSASRQMWDFYPTPNSPDPARNFTRQVTDVDDGDQWHLRVDHKVNDKQWVFGRFSFFNTDIFNNAALPTDGEVHDNRHRAWAGQYTYVIRPSMINELRVGGNRYDFGFVHETMGQDFTTRFGLPNLSPGTRLDGLPDLRVSGFPNLGGTAAVPLDRIETTVQVADGLTWIRGSHTVKLGGDMYIYRSMNDQVQFGRGRYSFSGSFTGQVGRTYTNGFADFQLGYPRDYTVLINPESALPNRPEYFRRTLYIQDDWKVSSRLTLNVGLRWEGHGGWRDAENRWGAFDTQRGEIVYAKDYPLPFKLQFPYRFGDTNAMEPPLNGFAPRFGFAYRPLRNARIVIRSAYGIFWSQLTSVDLVNTSLQVPPGQVRDSRTSGTTFPEFSFGELSVRPGQDPSSLIPRIPTVGAVALGLRRNPYIQQWNFGVETELLTGTGLSVSYVGSKGTHLRSNYQANAALPPGPGAIQARRRFSAFGSITLRDSDGFSTYNSLQIKAERRFRGGLSFLASHTWAKAIDNDGGFQNPDDRAAAKALSVNDQRHRFSLAAVYELPFGRGSALLSDAHPAIDRIVRGWQTSAVITMRTGLVFSATVPGDIPNTGSGTTYPNVTGSRNGNLPPGERTIDRWFDTAAFSVPAQFTFGNAGRNILEGPGGRLLDFGLSRYFTIREDHKIQFRAEFFNLTNRTNFGLPNASVGNVAFGIIRSSGSAREVQLALRYQF